MGNDSYNYIISDENAGKRIEPVHVPCGHEHRRNGEGIPYDIIVQGIQDIAPLSDVEIPFRYDQSVIK